MKEAIMNQEKLAKLQAQVRIGGKVNDKMQCHVDTFCVSGALISAVSRTSDKDGTF